MKNIEIDDLGGHKYYSTDITFNSDDDETEYRIQIASDNRDGPHIASERQIKCWGGMEESEQKTDGHWERKTTYDLALKIAEFLKTL